jgi:hypothetical protein
MNDAPANIARGLFVAEHRGDPLAAFPSLARHGQPYNLWLTGQVLDPILAGWLRWRDLAGEYTGAVAEDVARGSHRARAAFREILPSAMVAGDPAILAAMGVTANLQRTLGILGEHILAGGRLMAIPPAGSGPVFRLSRLWCGLVEYQEKSPYFTARIRAPLHPGRLQPRRRDPRHLANALWCSLAAVNERCDQTIAVLREEIVRSGLYTPDDIRRLRVPGAPRPPRI